ncbi:MAG: hypothetical protein MRY21_00860 [Simkaniaceae bacterium]|nr:hypothetical protein [Simkaniaceae bacterium]
MEVNPNAPNSFEHSFSSQNLENMENALSDYISWPAATKTESLEQVAQRIISAAGPLEPTVSGIFSLLKPQTSPPLDGSYPGDVILKGLASTLLATITQNPKALQTPFEFTLTFGEQMWHLFQAPEKFDCAENVLPELQDSFKQMTGLISTPLSNYLKNHEKITPSNTQYEWSVIYAVNTALKESVSWNGSGFNDSHTISQACNSGYEQFYNRLAMTLNPTDLEKIPKSLPKS